MAYYHLSVLVHRQAEKYGDRVALKYRDYEKEVWHSVSWNQFSQLVRQSANALVQLGIKEEENIAIYSQNKPECLYVEYGAFGNRAVSVPLYATSSPIQAQYIVNDAGVRFMFVGEQFQYDAAFSIISYCPTLEKLIIFDRSVQKDPRDTTSIYFDEFLELGEGLPHNDIVEERTLRATEDDLANILYTSGTTGEPKGVMLHHSCYLEVFRIHDIRLTTMSDQDVSMNFLPMTHVFEKAWCNLCVHKGVLICVNLRPVDIQTTIKEIRPTLMCSVPRFWEKVYSGVQEVINQATGIKKTLMQDAIRVGRIHNLDYLRVGKTPPLLLQLKYKFYEKTIYQLLKKTVGIENGHFFPTAGAAVPDEVWSFVRSVGIPMIVGYGLTESTATVSCTYGDSGYTIGSVGVPMPDLGVRIGENNEIQLKGKTITKGYYRKSEATAEAFTEDGWFRTGDAGYLKDGELYLTERIKDLFKTSNGKYIAPQALETKLVIDRYIDQIAIIADQRKFVSALIVPAYALVKEYADKKGIKYTDMKDLLQHPDIINLFTARIGTLQQQFVHYEQIKSFTLLPEPFSMERGEMTNTLKLKRSVIAENYKDLIDKMYEE
ncbi:long-chain fatty acid--CoA ligase [Bacteroides sp. 51]|uniref:AMP-dependent synthetase/ligase n=1 Tax=Bacteroides sp. 51 TaxID=2302938 RepID=UPI0013D699B5|nr:long-chain fatty acid--CoA ligase [Bacteroides sp. 51]NDV80985.1 long-chain fatty acid--CoA ligase [Bacteroides sp. 51]